MRNQCGAMTRDGDPCKSRAVMANGRCRMHGGKTPRGFALPQTKTGRHSKDLPTRLAGRYLESLNDPDLLNLSDDIALTDAFIEDARKGLDHGESGRLFAELKSTWDQLMTAQRAKDAAGVQMHMAELGALIRQGVGAYAARNEAADLIDRRRKLVESESKRRVQMQDMITSEKAMLLTSALLDAVVRNVDDPIVLARIGAEFGAITSRDDPAAA